MEEIGVKVDGVDSLPASEFNNNVRNELQNAVTNSGQTLDAGNLNQLGQAMGRYGGGGGDFYTESGVANAYVLTPVPPFITSKVYFEGMRVMFVAGNDSTDAGSTINVNTIGSVALVDAKGNPIGEKYITAGDTFTAIHNLANNEFRIISSSRVLPFGLISIFVGAVVDIPAGWQLCDGTNGTPDLRNNFIRGAGSTFNVDETGGSETTGSHVLSIAELPSHTHTTPSGTQTTRAEPGDNGPTGVNPASVTGSTGGGGGHTHPSTVPPFYALAFIMKL